MSGRECENLLCSHRAEYVFTDSLGAETYVCEGCMNDLPDANVRSLRTGNDQILRCECGYETSKRSRTAVMMDGSCPECGRSLDTGDER